MEYIEQTRALLKYDLPLNEIIYDFFDALKSHSRGYASFDYEMKGYERSKLVKLDINKEEVDALSFIVFAGNAEEKDAIKCVRSSRKRFQDSGFIPIQAAIGSKVIARGQLSRHSEKMYLQNVTAVISQERRNFLRSRRKERSVCARLVM